MNDPVIKLPTINDREALVLSQLEKHPTMPSRKLRHTCPHILNHALFDQTLNGLIDTKLADGCGATVDGREALKQAKAFYEAL